MNEIKTGIPVNKETCIVSQRVDSLRSLVKSEQLSSKQLEIVNALDHPQALVWTTFEHEGTTKECMDAADLVIFLDSGLASTDEQWNMQGSSFVDSLTNSVAKEFLRRNRTLDSTNVSKPKIVFVSVNQLGFGGSKFSGETRAREQDYIIDMVSDSSNADYLDIWKKAYDCDMYGGGKYNMIGHSAGGQAVSNNALRSGTGDGLFIALNASVGVERQWQFKLLEIATKAGKLSPTALKDLVQDIIIKKYTSGSSTSEQSRRLVSIHNSQANDNPEAFHAKLIHLGRSGQDTVFEAFAHSTVAPEQLLLVLNNLKVIFGGADILTPPHHIKAWHKLVETALDGALRKIGMSISVAESFSPHQEIPNATHDDVFVDGKIQDEYCQRIARMIVDQIELCGLFTQKQAGEIVPVADFVPDLVPPVDVVVDTFIEPIQTELPDTDVVPDAVEQPVEVVQDLMLPVDDLMPVSNELPQTDDQITGAVGVPLVEVVKFVPRPRSELPPVSQMFLKVVRQLQEDGYQFSMRIKADKNGEKLIELFENYQILENPNLTIIEKQAASNRLQEIFNYRYMFTHQFVSNLFHTSEIAALGIEQALLSTESDKVLIPLKLLKEMYLQLLNSESLKLYYLSKGERKYKQYQEIIALLQPESQAPIDVSDINLFLLSPFTVGNVSILKTSTVVDDRDNPKHMVMNALFAFARPSVVNDDIEFDRTALEGIFDKLQSVRLERWKQLSKREHGVFQVASHEEAMAFARVLMGE